MKQRNLRKFIFLLLAFLLCVSFTPEQANVVGKVTFPLGNVLVLSKGETRFRKATFNMPVINGDKIETKKQARCELTFNDGSVIRVDEQSIYTVEQAKFAKEAKEVESKLSIGKLWANVKKLVQGKDSWKLKSPVAVVAVRGTVYRMNAGADSSTQVLVYDGNVSVSPSAAAGAQPGMGVAPGQPRQVPGPTQVAGPSQVSMAQWFEIIKAQQQIVVRPDGSFAKSDFNMEDDAKLDWVHWNKERDAAMN
jgi:hypothetical protein